MRAVDYIFIAIGIATFGFVTYLIWFRPSKPKQDYPTGGGAGGGGGMGPVDDTEDDGSSDQIPEERPRDERGRFTKRN